MTRTAIAVFAALVLAPASAAAADNLAGQASVIDGDTLEIHGTRIRLWGIDASESSQLCRGEDSLQYRCGAKAANDLDAFIARRSLNCTPSRWTSMGGQWQLAQSAMSIWASGWCAMVSQSTGRKILGGDMTLSNAKLNTPGEGCGQGAMSSPGFSASVSGEVGNRVTVRTTRTPILENEPQGRSNVQPL